MNATHLLHDPQATGLLHRVRQDFSALTKDLGELASHTALKTLPNSARGIADEAKRQLAAGSAYASSRLRGEKNHREVAGWMGGALVVGLLSMGIYALYRNAIQDESATDTTMPESLEI